MRAKAWGLGELKRRAVEARLLLASAFGRFFIGEMASRIGDEIDRVAIPWLVQTLTGSTAALGSYMVWSIVPQLLGTPAGGVLVDRVDRRRLLVAINLLSGAVLVGLAASVVLERVVVWQVYVALAALSLLRAPYGPARMAIMAGVVRPDRLVAANALLAGMQSAAGVIGPAVAAWLMARGSVGVGIAADGASFWVAGACLASMGSVGGWVGKAGGGTGPRAVGKAARGFMAELVEGLGYLARRGGMLGLIVVLAVRNACVGLFIALEPAFVQGLGGGSRDLALLNTWFGAGALLGGVIGALLPRVRAVGLVICGGLVVDAVVFGLIVRATDIAAVSRWAVVWGLLAPIIQSHVSVVLQRLVDDDYRGRVFASFYTLASVVVPLAAGVGGVAAAWVGLAPVLTASVVVAGLAGAVAMLLPGTRQLELTG